MDQLAQQWMEKFERIWDPKGDGNYRAGSPGQRMVRRFVEYAPKDCTVNDYGCGTGRAAVELIKKGYKVNLVDIAPGALEEPIKEYIKNGVTNFTHAPLWDLPADFPVADWGYCIEVLMVLPPEKLDKSLSEIRRTCQNCFFQVADWDDVRLGMKCNTTRMDKDAWRLKLAQFWPETQYLASDEHHLRYLYVCRSEMR